MADLKITSVWKHFGEDAAVAEVSLAAMSGEFIALLGPSGCGKTTLLRLIAGFERPTGGHIRLGDRDMVDGNGLFVPPEHRRVGMVFQSYALWPHMNVAENVGYPLRVRGLRGAEANRRIDLALEQVGLGGLGDRRPANLSGGQRQRVALARCLAMEPDIVLLDEPLANLDAHLRESMQHQFRAFHQTTGATMVYVTHDQAEAMALADRIAVMDKGRIVQLAPPPELYDRPANEMVARFIGRGQVVTVTGAGEQPDGKCLVRIGEQVFSVRGHVDVGQPARLCIRPEWMTIAEAGAEGAITARIQARTYRGPVSSLEVAVSDDLTLSAEVPGYAGQVGDTVGVLIRDGWVLPG